MMSVSAGCLWGGGSLAVGKYITSRPAINSSRSAFVTAEQTEAGGGGYRCGGRWEQSGGEERFGGC